MRKIFVWLLMYIPAAAFAQIDIFGYVTERLDYAHRHAANPWDRTSVFEPGWNPVADSIRIEYGPINTAVVPLAVPDSARIFSNATANPATAEYVAGPFSQTIAHTWQITYGMTGREVATFNAMSPIETGAPASGDTQLRQGDTLAQSQVITTSGQLRQRVDLPPQSTITMRAFFHRRPVSVPFNVFVRIGGTFRFEAFRGNTRSSSVKRLGEVFRLFPHPNVQVVDHTYIIVRLEGQYTGAIGTTPGVFPFEVRAAQ